MRNQVPAVGGKLPVEQLREHWLALPLVVLQSVLRLVLRLG
jgi:hypothetical protein